MVDIIKRVNIDSSQLTQLDWEANGYVIRYRIKTENKNLSSHWSPIYIIPVTGFDQVEGSFFETLGEDGKTNITVVWDDLFDRPFYDVFVSFRGITLFNTFEYDEDDFIYHGTTQTHNYSFIKNDSAESIRIIIQPAADKKLIKSNFVIYDSEPLVS